MPAQFEVFEDYSGRSHFRIRDSNDQIIAGGEAYENREACMNAIQRVQEICHAHFEDLTEDKVGNIPNPKYQMYRGASGEFRFHLTNEDGKIIVQGKACVKRDECLAAMKVVKASDKTGIGDAPPKKPTKKNSTVNRTLSMAEPVVQVEEPARNTVKAPTMNEPKEPKELNWKDAKLEIPLVETSLVLSPLPGCLVKGEKVLFNGRLIENSTGQGLQGAKIRIYEEDKSPFGDDYLAFGTTIEDGSFSIEWKVRSLGWMKKTGSVYATFRGSEKFQDAKSGLQPINIE